MVMKLEHCVKYRGRKDFGLRRIS